MPPVGNDTPNQHRPRAARGVTEVDLAADARFRPVDDGPLGPTLSLEELAADKLLALSIGLRLGTSSTGRRS